MKKALFAAMVACAVVMTGCTGSFKLTSSIYQWHSSFRNKLTDEGLFIVSAFLCYPFTLAGDLLIFNTIEFWLNDNPLASTSFRAADGSEVMLVCEGNNAVKMETAQGVFTFTRGSDGAMLVTNEAGETFTAALQDGVLTMTDAEGEIVASFVAA